MRKYQFNKLIRSKIPDRMQSEGVLVNSKCLNSAEYMSELNNKLIEEAQEVVESNTREELIIELADLIEVIKTILKINMINMDEVEAARLKKLEINGDFQPENYINYIKVAEDNHKVLEYLENKNRPYKLGIVKSK